MEYHEKLYDVEVINRFTKKLYKVYRNKTLGGVFSIQDEHLCHMWKKVEVYPLFDVLEEMRNAHDSEIHERRKVSTDCKSEESKEGCADGY